LKEAEPKLGENGGFIPPLLKMLKLSIEELEDLDGAQNRQMVAALKVVFRPVAMTLT
jgi:hypothetical protein